MITWGKITWSQGVPPSGNARPKHGRCRFKSISYSIRWKKSSCKKVDALTECFWILPTWASIPNPLRNIKTLYDGRKAVKELELVISGSVASVPFHARQASHRGRSQLNKSTLFPQKVPSVSTGAFFLGWGSIGMHRMCRIGSSAGNRATCDFPRGGAFGAVTAFRTNGFGADLVTTLCD